LVLLCHNTFPGAQAVGVFLVEPKSSAAAFARVFKFNSSTFFTMMKNGAQLLEVQVKSPPKILQTVSLKYTKYSARLQLDFLQLTSTFSRIHRTWRDRQLKAGTGHPLPLA